MNTNLLTQLNPAQQQAVTHLNGNLLVLAGAGSGKTRVLVHRIAWLLQTGISPHHILAVTFTNKAAAEMRERLEQMLNLPLNSMWIGTFHGMAHRLLRLHWQEANLPQAFQIIDADDQARLLKRIQKTLNLDTEQWPIKQTQAFINDSKEKALRSDKIVVHDHLGATLLKIYQAYEETCQRSGVVDFSELLLRSYELLQKNTNLLEQYRQRFQYILIDEFQDTNSIQYDWIKLLAKNNASLTLVGDDDQSIYSWRGADVDNMHRLKHDYLNLTTVRLEQNYRSTGNILAAANAVIMHNKNRLGKTLWTQSNEGEAITSYAAINDIDEARYVVAKAQFWRTKGMKLADVAVLYRSNAQSRIIEDQLIQAGIAYRIYGGLRFFERAEIKDVLAYLRLIANHADDAAFERIINVPIRGIGEASLIILRNFARQNQCSLWDAAQQTDAVQLLPTRAQNSLRIFLQLITDCTAKIAELKLDALIDFVIKSSNLKLQYVKENRERQQSRFENLDELVRAAEQFGLEVEEANKPTLLHAFLAHAALETGERGEGDANADCVQLMTLHAAKGLEFPVVFLCGLEEGLFPHIMSMSSTGGLEEERRLCYVGMTRAMQKLYLLHAESRQLHGTTAYRRPSRFLYEIPTELLSDDSIITAINQPTFTNIVASSAKPAKSSPTLISDDYGGYKLGQKVTHATFGDGVITGFEGQGDHFLIQVKFGRSGTKWLSPKYAKLEKSN